MTAQELVSKLQLDGTHDGKTILALSEEKIDQLLARFDPEEDGLIHVSNDGFTMNHGDVGSRGIKYDFD